MARLDDFLSHNIDGYLAYDLATMSRNDANGQGVGYPLVMTASAAIEFLGALLSPDPFQPRGRSRAYFVDYWRRYLYPAPSPNGDFGDATYQLVRCGLAHSFALKGQIGILRHNPALHFKRDANGRLVIDAVQLGDDLMGSYLRSVKPLLVDPATAAQRAYMEIRLSEMEAAYAAEATSQTAFTAAAQVQASTHVGAAPPTGPSSSVSSGLPKGFQWPQVSSSE